jgi:recombination protein RecR
MYPRSIQKLIDLFSKFPTIGPRTATRFVFYLLKLPSDRIQELSNAILYLKKDIKTCHFCFNSFETKDGEKEICNICSDPRRNKSQIMIVEKEVDLELIEEIKKYKGLYLILGGTISTLKEESSRPIEEKIKERVEKLVERIKNPKANLNVKIKEIILALNPTTEGENTTLWLKRKLQPFTQIEAENIKITQLGKGLPVGGELEYADKNTLENALEGRK